MPDGLVSLFLCGDVMTGRGVDQILPFPGDPRLWESHARHAGVYVELAEAHSGPIPRPVEIFWPWGDALGVLDRVAPDVRLMNLETSITRSDAVALDKGVHYRMNPANVGCLTAARPDICALANNHVLDFGYPGLAETLETLAVAGVRGVGAGGDVDEAARPAIVAHGAGGRVIVFSLATRSSGVPERWAATAERAGVNLVREVTGTDAVTLARSMSAQKQAGDILVASVHWGSNWGYSVPANHIDFAHRLIDGGVDIVHGHSSHHVRPIEVYRGKLVLYGCGDLIDDYEGISGYEEYRDDLRLLYFARVECATGRLVGLRVVAMQSRQLRLRHASAADTRGLATVVNDISHGFGSRFDSSAAGTLDLVSIVDRQD